MKLSLVLVLVCVFGLVGFGRGDFLDSYFNDKTFGKNPGPCTGPTIADSCSGSVDDLPESAKKMQVCLSEDGQLVCDELGNVVKRGNFWIWNLQCKRIRVQDIKIQHVFQNANSEVDATVDVTNFRLSCTGNIRIEDLRIELSIIGITTTFEGPFNMDQENKDGVTLSLGMIFKAASGQNLLTELPQDVTIPYDRCDISPELGLTLQANLNQFESLTICLGPLCLPGTGLVNAIGANNILNLITTLIEALLGAITCQLLEEAAFLESGGLGPLNLVWADVKAQVDEWALSQGQNVELVDSDAYLLSTFPYTGIDATKLANSIDFSDSTIVELVSVALNNWLGAQSTSPQYQGKLVINELIDLVTEPDGEFFFDLQARNVAPEVTIPLNISDVTVRVNKIRLKDFNSISQFDILDNKDPQTNTFTKYKRSFNNSLLIEDLFLELETYIRLDRGLWVTESCNFPSTKPATCSSDSAEFTFRFTVDVADIFLQKFSIMTLLNPSELDNLQLGQLIDIDFSTEPLGALSNALVCVAPAVYGMNITNLKASLGDITDPVMENFDGSGLSILIQDAIELGTDIVRGGLRTKFPGIANGPIREVLNEALLENVVLATGTCAPWVGPSGNGPEDVDFNSALFSPVYTLINDGVGGNPIKDTEVDLNELFEIILKYYEEKFPTTFPLESTATQGTWKLSDAYKNDVVLTKFDDPSRFVKFDNLVIENLDSINKLIVNGDQSGLNIILGLGGQLQGQTQPNPLLLNADMRVKNGLVDEEATFTLQLRDMEFDFTLARLTILFDFIKALYVNQLDNIPCLLAAVKAIEFPEELRTGSVGTLGFELDHRPGSSTPPTDKTFLALQQLATEQPAARFQALLSTIVDIALDFVLDTIEAIPDEYKDLTTTTCLTAEDPTAFIGDLFALDALPNITQLQEECLAVPGPLESIATLENNILKGRNLDGEIFEFGDNPAIEIFQELIDFVKTGQTLQDVLVALGNATGNPIVDAFQLEDDNTTVTLLLPLSVLGLRFDFRDKNPGFLFDAGVAKLKGINRLTNSFSVLEPVPGSRFTTAHSLKFDSATPLDIEISGFIEMDGAAAGEPGVVIREELTLDMVVNGFVLEAETVIGLNTDVLVAKSLAHFIQVGNDQSIGLADHAFDCLLETLYEDGFNLRYFNLSVTDLQGPTFDSSENILSKGMEMLVDALVDVFTQFYLGASDRISQNCFRTFINDFIAESQVLAKAGGCPRLEDIPKPTLTDPILSFSASQGLKGFQDLFHDNLATDNYKTLNVILEAAFGNGKTYLTKNQDVNDAFNFGFPIIYNSVNYGTVLFEAANLELVNMSTVSDLRVAVPYNSDGSLTHGSRSLLPEDPSDLPYTTLTQLTLEGPFSIKGDFILNVNEFFPDIPQMVNEIDLTLTITKLQFGLELLLELNLLDLLDVRLNSVTSLEEIPCALVPVNRLAPLDFNLSIADVSLTVDCNGDCDFPFLRDLNILGPYTTTNGDELSTLINGFVEYVNNYVSSKGAQGVIDAAIATASEDCDVLLGLAEDFLDGFQESPNEDVASIFLYIFLGATVLAGAGGCYLVPLHRRRREQTMASTFDTGHVAEETMAGDLALTELNMKSIFAHPVTPPFAKFVVPMVLVLNILGLVIAIVFSDAANIIVEVTLLDAKTSPVVLVPFTLASTINQMWNSGAWPLAILIGLFSCAWPVVKNAILMVIWFLPATLLGKKKQHAVLELLDILGKWSFLDVYVIVITLAALRTYVEGSMWSIFSFLPPNFLIVDVNVTPETGIILLCFVCATSLLINHTIIYFHNRLVEANRKAADKVNGNKIAGGLIPAKAAKRTSIWNHKFAGKDRRGNTLVIKPTAKYGMLGLIAASLFCIVIGISLPVITFELDGLVGLLLEEISEGLDRKLQTRTYSVISMGTALSEAPSEGVFDLVILFFFQFLYAMSVYIAPFAMLVILSVMWVTPMRLNNSKSLFYWTKIASYWSSLEVYLLALIATIIEIEVVSQFIVDFITADVCGNIVPLLSVVVADPDINSSCLNVVGNFEIGAVFLFIGLFLQLVAFWCITTVGAAVLDDRYYAAYKNLRADVQPKKLNKLGKFTIRMMTSSVKQTNDVDESGLENLLEEDEVIEYERGMCCGALAWCCSDASGQRATDARIAAWQQKFGVQSVSGQRRESPNPRYSAYTNGTDDVEV